MRRLIILTLIMCGCGNSNDPVPGVYDLINNKVVSDTPTGCAIGMAAPMTVELAKEKNNFAAYICSDFKCEDKFLYATSPDGFSFMGNPATDWRVEFDISYDTKMGNTTIDGTGTTSSGGCEWDTLFNGRRQ